MTRSRARRAARYLRLAALAAALAGCGDGPRDDLLDGGSRPDAGPAGGPTVDFWVTRGGPVRVPLAELSPPIGNHDLAHLRVRHDATRLAVQVVETEGQAPAVLVQVPEAGHDGHSREIHLFVDLAPDDPSPRIAERELTPSRAPPRVERVLVRRTLEERGFWAFYHPAKPGEGFPDCWVGPALHTNESADSTFAGFPATARAARLEVTLIGGAVFEHVVEVGLGGRELGEVRFAGFTTHTASFDLGDLAPEPEGRYTLAVALRSVEVGDKVHLGSASLVVATEPDFDGAPLALDCLEAMTVDLLLPAETPETTIAWEVSDPPRQVTLSWDEGRPVLPRFEPGHDYVLFDPARVPAPAGVIAFDEVDQTARLLDQPGDLVVIAPASFQPALAPWLSARRAQGFTPMVRTPREVYQTFSAGRPTPAAISAYVDHGRSSWGGAAPRALLLVGDATPELDPMPDFAVPTRYLWLSSGKWIPSDLVYALPDWDHPDGPAAPLLAVGRIPARTSEEVAAAVSRSLAHSASPPDPVLFLSDDNDESFRTMAELTRAELPEGIGSQALHLLDYDALYPNPEPPPPQWEEPAVVAMRADLRLALANRVSLVQYFGHGDLNHVAGEGLLAQRDDLYNLDEILVHGGLPPVFVLHSCLSGYFAMPSLPHTIAESMMLLPDPTLGAAAVISPAAYADSRFAEEFGSRFQAALTGTSATVGEALVASAHGFLGDSYCTWLDCKVLMMSVSLLGDPTLPSLSPR